MAHGRAEAFDYLLGERTTPSAARAIRAAAAWLRSADHPVLSVNGNVAALAATEVARVARALPTLRVEVNLFHRTEARAVAVARRLRRAGVRAVLGIHPTARIPHLPSDRARVDRRGILVADVVLVPLEDGDRAEALRALGKRVIAVDLNPLSRTARSADLPIVDEVTRALSRLAEELERPAALAPSARRTFDRRTALADAYRTMERRFRKAATAGVGRAAERAAPRRSPETGRRRRRTR
jgi:4-phosphopantoate--beta-alanine ligase